MKLKLSLYYSTLLTDEFKELEVKAQTATAYKSEYELHFKEVTVYIPDDCVLTEKEFNNLVYISKLTEAERVVELAREALTKAEEQLKNMLAIEHAPPEHDDIDDDRPF